MKYGDIISECNLAMEHWELDMLLQELEGHDIKRVLEIGVHKGGSMRVWNSVFKPELLLGICETDQLDDDWKKVSRANGNFGMVFSRSQNFAAFNAVRRVTKGKPFDFLFIDGSHYFSDVKSDWDWYWQMVRPGGFVAFHDVKAEETDSMGVPEFWRVLTKLVRTKTIWHPPDGTGIGVVYLRE